MQSRQPGGGTPAQGTCGVLAVLDGIDGALDALKARSDALGQLDHRGSSRPHTPHAGGSGLSGTASGSRNHPDRAVPSKQCRSHPVPASTSSASSALPWLAPSSSATDVWSLRRTISRPNRRNSRCGDGRRRTLVHAISPTAEPWGSVRWRSSPGLGLIVRCGLCAFA
jgi:hypothetical protein